MQQILSFAKKIKRTCFPKPPSMTEIRLIELTKSCEKYISQNRIIPKTKILWPTLFNQDHTWWAHDALLIHALRLRGADIIPTMCDQVQADQCMIYSGVWQGSFEPDFAERRKNICATCVNSDLRLWDILKIRPIRLSSYVSEGERVDIWQKANEIVGGNWEDCVLDDYPLGREVWKAVVNNNLQGEIKPYWQKNANEMAAHHIYNILILFHVYQRIFSIISPQCVVGNGGYYYQWGVVNHLCQKKNIPYYRYFPVGLQPISWNYALNSSEIVHLTPAWDSWIKQPWTQQQQVRVINDLAIRGLEINPKDENKFIKLRLKLNISPHKPTLLALTGVIWDANTNIQSKAFQNMYLWLWETIEWFTLYPEYQLIIRIHPAENAVPSIAPFERSKFDKELKERGITVPKNVVIIPSDEKIETYDLMQLADVATVYMSTTGLEFACLGKSVITIGPVHYAKKGFTFDISSKEGYLQLLSRLLGTKETSLLQEQRQELALRYWYLYAFHASCVSGLMETPQKHSLSIKRGIDGFSSHPKLLSAEDLLPGANAQVDYLCDSILNHLPIMGENRWPPEILEKYCKI